MRFLSFNNVTLQTDISIADQTENVYTFKTVTCFSNRNYNYFTRNHNVMDEPGLEKSHELVVSILFGIINPFNCLVTSLASRRATMFKKDLHRRFCIKINENYDKVSECGQDLNDIYNQPKLLLQLPLDVLSSEECRCVGVELLSRMDLFTQE